MSKASAVVELDLLGLRRRPAAADPPPSSSSFRRSTSFREMQCAIARMDPAVVKSVIASGSPGSKSAASSGAARLDVEAGDDAATSPLTIFYNGSVSVFELTHDKAKDILRMAEKASSGGILEALEEKMASGDDDNEGSNGGELPIARRKSLQRFLERRKERLTT